MGSEKEDQHIASPGSQLQHLDFKKHLLSYRIYIEQKIIKIRQAYGILKTITVAIGSY